MDLGESRGANRTFEAGVKGSSQVTRKSAGDVLLREGKIADRSPQVTPVERMVRFNKKAVVSSNSPIFKVGEGVK